MAKTYIEPKAGSSPLARGKRGLQSLIVADALAHPRSRGENTSAKFRDFYCMGSSPLARGKPFKPRVGPVHVGLIPARAGKT